MTRIMICTALAIGISTTPVWPEDGNAGRGEEIYQDYCATCHGLEMTGHGPMAGVLLIPPANLSRLEVRNEGEFPTGRVVKRIDGREPLVSHGSPMPVYGDFFQGKGVMLKSAHGQPILTSQPVADLEAYLQAHHDRTD